MFFHSCTFCLIVKRLPVKGVKGLPVKQLLTAWVLSWADFHACFLVLLEPTACQALTLSHYTHFSVVKFQIHRAKRVISLTFFL